MHFKIVTYHSSLKWLQSIKEPEGRLAFWSLKLQAYNFKFIHCPGSSHQNEDGLSCLPITCTVLPESEWLYNLLLNNNSNDEPLLIQKSLKSI